MKGTGTALSDYFSRTGHVFDFDDSGILGSENNLFKKLFEEMFQIRKTKKTLNFLSDKQSLSSSLGKIVMTD